MGDSGTSDEMLMGPACILKVMRKGLADGLDAMGGREVRDDRLIFSLRNQFSHSAIARDGECCKMLANKHFGGLFFSWHRETKGKHLCDSFRSYRGKFQVKAHITRVKVTSVEIGWRERARKGPETRIVAEIVEPTLGSPRTFLLFARNQPPFPLQTGLGCYGYSSNVTTKTTTQFSCFPINRQKLSLLEK